MKTWLSLAFVALCLGSVEAQAWTLVAEGGPSKVEAVEQKWVVLHDGTRQTTMWAPTLNVEGEGRVTLVFALPAPPTNVQRLTPDGVEEFAKLAQLSWLDSARKRGEADRGSVEGVVVPQDAVSVHTLTTQGEAAGASLSTLLGELGLPELAAKDLKPYVADNWTFAAISWDAKPGVQRLSPLRIDFVSPAPVLPLRAMSDLGGRVEAFFVGGEALAAEAEENLGKAGFVLAMDRRKLGPNPKKSMWIAGQTSFLLRNLGVGAKTVFLERFEVQRGFVAAFVLEDLSKAARKWKTEPFAAAEKTSLKMETVEAVAPPAVEESDQGAGDAGVGADVGVSEPEPALDAPLAEVSDVLGEVGELDWTMILGGVGVLFLLTVVTVVQVRRRL